ncbi:MAG TPA: GNAT family N-acetyltransferase [Ktedonobacterales bacterium]|nr:GNAT family N-acetyltransferase [Ktedonobacterales bacterium]
MTIRVLTEPDAETYQALRLRSLKEDPDPFGATYDEWVNRPMAQVTERLRNATPEAYLLGAFEGDTLAGIIAFTRDTMRKFRHKGSITSMYVAPEARGKGLARALLIDVIARGRELAGLEQITLSVVSDNTAARNLYLSAGFEIFGTERHAMKDGDRYLDEDFMVYWLA